MEGDKWIVKRNIENLKTGDILTEKMGYNFETECKEECGD